MKLTFEQRKHLDIIVAAALALAASRAYAETAPGAGDAAWDVELHEENLWRWVQEACA